MTTRTKEQIQKEINELTKIEVLVETNEGTYGAAEACRAIGTGDPKFADRKVYETVGGSIRTSGPGEDSAPGRMRRIGYQTLSTYRQQLAALRAELKVAR